MHLLEVNNISKSYKRKEVLKNITFSIEEGEVVALIGPNGAGKTTLMKIIAGLERQDCGEIKISGSKIEKKREEYLAKLACIIENPSLYEMMSGYANIDFIRKLNNVSNHKMEEILSFIDIGEKIKDKVKNYSLGMKQRLALGIALLQEPQVLILDEPTNGLDPQGVIEFRELLERCSKEKKMSILISSHILAELEKICNRTLFIKNGQLIEKNNIEKNIQNVILTVEQPEQIHILVSKLAYVNDSKINKNKITIQINKKYTSQLLTFLATNQVEYENIEIENNTIETEYSNLYIEKKEESN